jgi:hypothetical protein
LCCPRFFSVSEKISPRYRSSRAGNDGALQWDDAKAAANYATHGVTFEAARDVFKDPFAIEQMDDRQNYGEERWKIQQTTVGANPR